MCKRVSIVLTCIACISCLSVFAHAQGKPAEKKIIYGAATHHAKTVARDINRMEEMAPFDGIMITAAVDHIPSPLLKQLKDGGRLILTLGNPFSYQNLVLVTKTGEDFVVKQITGVLFVPMTGRALKQ